MIIKGIKPDAGIFFAIWPRRVRGVGLVAFEWLHYRYVEGTGWANDGAGWEYTRWVPQERYDAGDRNPVKGGAALRYPFPEAMRRASVEGFATPPDIQKCGNLRTDGPTPCWYPHCTCMNVGGSVCGEPVKRSFDEGEQYD